jgi:hypothetical protein
MGLLRSASTGYSAWPPLDRVVVAAVSGRKGLFAFYRLEVGTGLPGMLAGSRGGLLAEGFWRLAELGVVGGVGRRRAAVAG